MLWLIYLLGKAEPIATVADEDDAKLIVRAINVWDTLVGGETMAHYSPANDPTDLRSEIVDVAELVGATGL